MKRGESAAFKPETDPISQKSGLQRCEMGPKPDEREGGTTSPFTAPRDRVKKRKNMRLAKLAGQRGF